MGRYVAVHKGLRRLEDFYYNVKIGARSSNEAGHTADAAAKVMTPSEAPDPLHFPG